MNKLRVIVAQAMLAITVFGFQQQPDGVDGIILLGHHASFILKQPEGWIMDGSIAKAQGLDAVLYKDGSSWKEGLVVMYVRVIPKDAKRPSLERFVQEDVNDFLKRDRSSKVSDSAAVLTRDKKQAVVKNFYDAENKNHESVAYIDEGKVVIVMALSSRSNDEYEKSLAAFKSLAGSYFFVKELSPK